MHVKIDYHSKANWQNHIGKKHSLSLDLDVAASDFIKSRDVVLELTIREEEFKKEIHQLVIAQIIPQIIADSGVDGKLPEGNFKTEWNINSSSDRSVDKPIQIGESVTVRSKLNLILNLKSDRSVNAMQALNNARAGVAGTLADDIISALKFTYLGITSTDTDTQSHTSGDAIIDFSTKSKSDFRGN